MTPRAAALAFLTCTCAAAPVFGAAGKDWPEYLGGPDRSHYSALDQINTSNVESLKLAWEFHSGDLGQMQCNPIIVHGVLYGATGTSAIFALDAGTGKQLWRFTVPGVLDAVLANDRGVTYWTDGKSERILCTVDSWLYALDARTGEVIKDFGTEGRASLKAGLGPQAQENTFGKSRWASSRSSPRRESRRPAPRITAAPFQRPEICCSSPPQRTG
jgi:quinoprotein glucose dehydrogenase